MTYIQACPSGSYLQRKCHKFHLLAMCLYPDFVFCFGGFMLACCTLHVLMFSLLVQCVSALRFLFLYFLSGCCDISCIPVISFFSISLHGFSHNTFLALDQEIHCDLFWFLKPTTWAKRRRTGLTNQENLVQRG